MHICLDSRTGLAHSAVVTAVNVHDKHPLPELLHGNEQRVYGDSAYASEVALIGLKVPRAKDFTNQRVRGGAISTRLSARRTTTSPRFAPGSNTSSPRSSGYGTLPGCTTEALPRTPRARLWCWVWPTSTWRDSALRHECARVAHSKRASAGSIAKERDQITLRPLVRDPLRSGPLNSATCSAQP